MTAYLLSLEADGDLNAIWEYISSQSLNAADRFLVKIFEVFDLLAQNPYLGHKREDLVPFPTLF